MKQYHTKITINSPLETVWTALVDTENYPNWNPLVGKLEGNLAEGQTIKTYIIPLGNTYSPKIIAFVPYNQLTWKGVQGASFLMAGKHYYKLRKIDNQTTELLHGEYFTGLFSFFIPKKLLQKMENAFLEHNKALKVLLEKNKNS
ncbi:SRPBCC domain-containing protein [Bernardetia sp. MNP-M8]|uniref:SRPBCC domain-containing protein n=1 Tax=Bernardetia sp. MNP-M8 TaxID=3127470 RepID=UPI0030D54EEF